MEKKLKIAEFAALIGVTAKTVYKMVDREEIKTVNEKVNNRLMLLIVIVILLLALVSYFTFNIASAQKKADTTQEIVNPE